MVSHRARVSRREDAATMSIYPARVRRESKDGRRMISCSRATPRAVDRAAHRRYPSSAPARFRGEKNKPAHHRSAFLSIAARTRASPRGRRRQRGP